MKLYHGTNGDRIQSILKTGLKPRGPYGLRNNWHESESNPHCVYLTDSYAPYFAFNARKSKMPMCAVIEIETEGLESNLTFDEDCWEQLGRRQDDAAGAGTVKQRTRWYRQQQRNPVMQQNFRDSSGTTGWRLSLKALGTCAHVGIIPPTAITRAIVFPFSDENVNLAFVFDPSITLFNQQICGALYKTLTARLFGDPNPVSTLSDFDRMKINFSLDNAVLWTPDAIGNWQQTPYRIERDAALDVEREQYFARLGDISIETD